MPPLYRFTEVTIGVSHEDNERYLVRGIGSSDGQDQGSAHVFLARCTQMPPKVRTIQQGEQVEVQYLISAVNDVPQHVDFSAACTFNSGNTWSLNTICEFTIKDFRH